MTEKLKDDGILADTPQPSALNFSNMKENGSTSTVVEEDNVEYITGISLWLVLGSLTLVYFLIMLDSTILATAIPFITDDFHSLLDVGWYASAYQLTSAALQPLTGKVYAKMNTKVFYVLCMIVFETGSAICGAASSSVMLIVGRAVAGIGGAGLLNGALIILNSSVPPHRQPALLGVLMGIGQLGIAFGPLIGGAFTEYVSWRWCFYINLPVGGLVTAAIAFIKIPDQLQKPHWKVVMKNAVQEFDIIGFALIGPAAIQLLLALQYGGHQYAWNSSQVIGLFCGAGATFIAWLIWDYRQGDEAMVPFSMLRNQVVWAACVTGVFWVATIFVTGYYLPIYFQAVRATTPFRSGVDVLPNILAQMVFGVIGGVFIQKVGYYTPFMFAGSILNAIGCGLTSMLSPTTSTGEWIGFQIIFGSGRGLALAVPFLAVQNVLPKSQIPVAISLLGFLQNLAGAVFIVISQTVFTNGLVDYIPKLAPSVSPLTVLTAGSTAFRQVVPLDMLDGVVMSYSLSLNRVFYLCAGLAVPCFLFAWFLGWDDIRKKADPKENESSSASEAPIKQEVV